MARLDSSLALAREVIHSLEQFVLSSPDLDTSRFLQRLRATAAGLVPKVDSTTIELYRQWIQKAIDVFSSLQRRYVAEREDEMWRLIRLYSEATERNRKGDDHLVTNLRHTHSRLRELCSLEDIRAARERLEAEVKEAQSLVERKIREDKERAAALAQRLARLEEELIAVRGQANYDVLTGVLHRGIFTNKLSQLVAAGQPCALAMVDVDSFKTINDTLGHTIGDRILVQVAQSLTRIMRSTDLVGRFGGDEFCFLALGSNAEQLSQRLAGVVARRHVRLELDGERVVSVLLSLSVGVSQARIGDSGAALMDRADQALLEAKKGGKGGVRIA